MTANPAHGYPPHIPDEDTTITRSPSPDQARALRLLEYGTPGAGLVRLSIHGWAHVDRVVAGLARMGVPPVQEAQP